MAVGIRIKLPGVTQEQFDKVNAHVNRAGPIDEGWGVIDFWESRGDFDAFFGSRVKAAIDATGVEMSGAPDIKEFPVHEFIKA
jgi:hypothetical protein